MDIEQEARYENYIKLGVDENIASLLVMEEGPEKEHLIRKLNKNNSILEKAAENMQPFHEIKLGEGEFFPNKSVAQIIGDAPQ